MASNLIDKLPLCFACRKTCSGKVAMSLITNRKSSQKQQEPTTQVWRAEVDRCGKHSHPMALSPLFRNGRQLSKLVTETMLVDIRTGKVES